ncbi:MAG: hypothetical protein IT581_17805 [Verrucomicrobiales bacterium]|nr:hypothetical protein [Verrucomicrobiales bacterium]
MIGSQAIHASCARPPVEALLSLECDIYPLNRPEVANRLERELGRSSKFARLHGFYVDVVDPAIATLPSGWRSRLRPLRAGKVTARCLEIHDLAISKLAAGRLRDLEFTGALLKRGLIKVPTVRRRIAHLEDPRQIEELRLRLRLLLLELG